MVYSLKIDTLYLNFYHIDEYTREKSLPIKVKKRAKKRPQSASAAGSESVRRLILFDIVNDLLFSIGTKSCSIEIT